MEVTYQLIIDFEEVIKLNKRNLKNMKDIFSLYNAKFQEYEKVYDKMGRIVTVGKPMLKMLSNTDYTFEYYTYANNKKSRKPIEETFLTKIDHE